MSQDKRPASQDAASQDAAAKDAAESDPDGDLADVKAKMRAALDRKRSRGQGGRDGDAPLREKAHGSEVHGGAGPKMHRRKSG